MANIFWNDTGWVSGIALFLRVLAAVASLLAVGYTWHESNLKKIDTDAKFAALTKATSPRAITPDQKLAFAELFKNYSLGLVAVRTVSPDPECTLYSHQIAEVLLKYIQIETQFPDNKPTSETGIVIYAQARNEKVAREIGKILGTSDVRFGPYGKYEMIIAIAGKSLQD